VRSVAGTRAQELFEARARSGGVLTQPCAAAHERSASPAHCALCVRVLLSLFDEAVSGDSSSSSREVAGLCWPRPKPLAWPRPRPPRQRRSAGSSCNVLWRCCAASPNAAKPAPLATAAFFPAPSAFSPA